MSTIFIRSLIVVLWLLSASQSVFSQVKTKTFDQGIPTRLKPDVSNARTVVVDAPFNFKEKKESGSKGSNLYVEQFAVRKETAIDFFKSAAFMNRSGVLYYNLTLTAKEALNLSMVFGNFYLSPHAVLSIFNDYELTDSITADENNELSSWATRLYQGDHVNISLRVPEKEQGLSKLNISQVNFGYKEIGTTFFGNRGAAAPCNVNVLCSQGNGWNDERQSVALILTDGAGYCTGAMVMNTCGTNIPYLLSAYHVYDQFPRLQNWVFQFNYWSTTCNPNTGGREDLQINGCKLRASHKPTDMLLVELNEVPLHASVSYSGWNRSSTPATSTTTIHHPRGDLMKISRDFDPPQTVSFPLLAVNGFWRATFDDGIVQNGSSGAPLYDENHRIVGALTGYQFNACLPENNTCWCSQQIPAVGEYGKFDLFWTGGGHPYDRLSNWLDPKNTGAITTNSALVSSLPNTYLSLNITGPSRVCSDVFTLTGAPTGSTITWTISNPALATLTPNGSQVTVTSTGGYGTVTLNATINDACYRNTTASITFDVGGSRENDFTITPQGENGCYQVFSLYDVQSIGPDGLGNGNVNWEWSYLKESTTVPTSWQNFSCYNPTPTCSFSLYEEGNYQIRMIATDLCGVEHSIIKGITVSGSCGGGWFKVTTQPNPVKDRLTIEWTNDDVSKLKNKKAALKIIDKSGVIYHRQELSLSNQSRIDIDTYKLVPGTYFVIVETSAGVTSKQFLKTR